MSTYFFAHFPPHPNHNFALPRQFSQNRTLFSCPFVKSMYPFPNVLTLPLPLLSRTSSKSIEHGETGSIPTFFTQKPLDTPSPIRYSRSTSPWSGFVPARVYCLKGFSIKTIIYIDGQNFLYRAAEYIIAAGLASNKQDIHAIDLPITSYKKKASMSASQSI